MLFPTAYIKCFHQKIGLSNLEEKSVDIKYFMMLQLNKCHIFYHDSAFKCSRFISTLNILPM